MKKIPYLLLGAVFTIVLMVACGSSGTNSFAQTIGNAIDVLFDNTNSNLSSNNVQDAITELNNKVDFSSSIVGTWSGISTSGDDGVITTQDVTINADGTYTCTKLTTGHPFFCQSAQSWEVKNKLLKLTTTSNGTIPFAIQSLDDTNLVIVFEGSHPEIIELVKN